MLLLLGRTFAGRWPRSWCRKTRRYGHLTNPACRPWLFVLDRLCCWNLDAGHCDHAMADSLLSRHLAMLVCRCKMLQSGHLGR